MRRGFALWAAALMILGGLPTAWAQSDVQGTPPPVDIEADPIRCWWRTSASAVKVGEPFSLVLTCAVVDTETTTVVPDQSRLEPGAMQLPPFEIIGGQRGPDLHSDLRRFFQYQYTLRFLGENLFGRDATIPSVQINYYVQSRVEGGESIRGRDQAHLLPSASVRILSLVPDDAAEIRDAPSWTFSEIDRQRFRSRVFLVGAGVWFTAAALVVVAALLRLVARDRGEGALRRRLLSDGAILRGVGRELAAVRRETERAGWSHELAGRALAAFRIAATVALSQRVSQVSPGAGEDGHEGQVVMRGGWLRGKKVLASGSATTDQIARELAANRALGQGRRASLTELQTALARLTAAQFGRDDKLDGAALDESVTDGVRVLRHLRVSTLWPVRKFKSVTEFATEIGNRAWSR